MDEAISHIREVADATDEAGRARIQNALRELQFSLETPYETVIRLSVDNLQVPIARVAADLGLFKTVAANEAPLAATTLAEKTGAAPELMNRICRYLGSIGMLKEVGRGEYAASNVTKALADPGYEAGIYHAHDNLGPVLQTLPDFLAETKYQDIVDGSHTVFQKAFNTDLSCFAWLPTQPKRFLHIQRQMAVQRNKDWLDVFPLENEVGSWSAEPEKALFVDVGGGMGGQCRGLRAKYPKVPGRVILQELPQLVERLPPMEGIDKMAQNFFEPQVIKGAKLYYLRQILHDYPDDKCVTILKNLVPAMDADSRIILDEMVLPETGAQWQETATDLAMMAALGSKERTGSQWEALVSSAGCKILETFTYSWPVENAVQVVVPK